MAIWENNISEKKKSLIKFRVLEKFSITRLKFFYLWNIKRFVKKGPNTLKF